MRPEVKQRRSCRCKLRMPLTLIFQKSVKELAECLILRCNRIFDRPQLLCRFSFHHRLLSFQVGCRFQEELALLVQSSSVSKVESQHWLYANNSRLQDNPCRVWPQQRYARHHHNSSEARQSRQATSQQAQTPVVNWQNPHFLHNGQPAGRRRRITSPSLIFNQ